MRRNVSLPLALQQGEGELEGERRYGGLRNGHKPPLPP